MSSATPVLDSQGNVYFVGSVTSDIVPVTAGAFQTNFSGGTCGSVQVFPNTSQQIACNHGFAAKISADGTTVLYATYLEGNGSDYAAPIGVDASGDLFVLIQTTSTNFPQTGSVNGFLEAPVSGTSDFILELSSDGSQILLSDSLGLPGGSLVSTVNASALAPNGGLVLAGTTDGTAFPTTPGAYLSARPNANLDGFILEWDYHANNITHSTLIGGSNQDRVTNLAIDSSGDVYVAGYSASTDFPVTPGAFYSPGAVVNSQVVNDFVAKLDPTLSSLEFSALFGGSYHPIPSAIAVDAAGDVYVDGWGSAGMPVTPGAYETSYSPGFLAKLAGTNGSRIYLTCGATSGQIVPASDGSVWVAGSPVNGGFVEHLSADGSRQLYGTDVSALLTMPAPGVVLASSSTAFFQIENFNIPSPPPQGPLITSVVNGASFEQPGYVAPGEIISITGLSIGPAQAASFSLEDGVVSSSLNGLQVFVNNVPAPILYASANQINAIVPWDISPPASGSSEGYQVTLEISNPWLNTPLSMIVTPVASQPGIFQSGGAGLILNQDGTVNSSTNPAKQGSIISLFVTGLGPLSHTPLDGSVAAAGATPTLPIGVFLGSGPQAPYMAVNPAAITYAGDAPDEIEGLQQINLTLPAGALFNSLYVTAGSGVSNAVTFFEQ